jgi:hypothetical protein
MVGSGTRVKTVVNDGSVLPIFVVPRASVWAFHGQSARPDEVVWKSRTAAIPAPYRNMRKAAVGP